MPLFLSPVSEARDEMASSGRWSPQSRHSAGRLALLRRSERASGGTLCMRVGPVADPGKQGQVEASGSPGVCVRYHRSCCMGSLSGVSGSKTASAACRGDPGHCRAAVAVRTAIVAGPGWSSGRWSVITFL